MENKLKINNEYEIGLEKYSKVCIKLLKNVVYREESIETWNLLEQYLNEIRKYFEKIGLRIIYREDNGYCYLTQKHELDEKLDNYKLINKQPFSYRASLLIIILKKYLYNYEYEDDSNKCIISQKYIEEEMRPYLEESTHDISVEKKIKYAIDELIRHSLVKDLTKNEDNCLNKKYEIKRVIEDKIKAEDAREFLEDLKNVKKK